MARRETDDDGAARWAIRLDAGPLAPAAQAALDAWLAADGRRCGALLRARATLAYLDHSHMPDILPAIEHDPVPQRWAIGRRGLLGAALASGAAAICAGIFLRTREQVIDTGIGELRRVPLADGSSATLNTASRLAVEMAPRQRTIELHNGEAWFHVASDRARPFVVEAGEVRVRAVGTAFSVRRRDDGADVLVTEGTVETWVVGREAELKQITAGSHSFVTPAQPEIEVAAAPQEIERALAWRSGVLALDGETLAYAVQEINRYNVRKLVIADPSLGDEQLVGYFSTTEPENFGRVVGKMIGARVVDEGDVIRLVKAPS